MTTKELYIKSQKDLQDWLSKNHTDEEGIWLVFDKGEDRKVSMNEIVDTLLCFGWIDGRAGNVDEKRTKLYVRQRNPKSAWSRFNKNKVERLIKEGLMKEPGLKMIELAKKTGTWDALNDVENLIVPEDLENEFKKYKNAKANFDSFSRSYKRAALFWITSAKREETRRVRVEKIAKSSDDNEKILE